QSFLCPYGSDTLLGTVSLFTSLVFCSHLTPNMICDFFTQIGRFFSQTDCRLDFFTTFVAIQSYTINH
ncbi:MAG: hypothetical protein LUC85_06465, partial [Bacteroidales bacterium]|nr:hypothetical protein [Bacteroidales bacterium]